LFQDVGRSRDFVEGHINIRESRTSHAVQVLSCVTCEARMTKCNSRDALHCTLSIEPSRMSVPPRNFSEYKLGVNIDPSECDTKACFGGGVFLEEKLVPTAAPEDLAKIAAPVVFGDIPKSVIEKSLRLGAQVLPIILSVNALDAFQTLEELTGRLFWGYQGKYVLARLKLKTYKFTAVG